MSDGSARFFAGTKIAKRKLMKDLDELYIFSFFRSRIDQACRTPRI